MKSFLIFLFVLMLNPVSGLCQHIDSVPKKIGYDELRIKMKLIDEYVSKIDSNKRLKIEKVTSEYTSGAIGEQDDYIDNLTGEQVKIENILPGKNTIYYKNRKMVMFKKIYEGGAQKRDYYEDGKFIGSTTIQW